MVDNPSVLTVTDVRNLVEGGETVAFVDSRNPIAWGSSKVKLPVRFEISIHEVRTSTSGAPS